MREIVTQKEFYTFHEHYRQLRGTDDRDAVISVVDMNLIDGEPYKAYVWLDKGRQIEIGGFVPCRSEWFVDKTAKTAVDGAEKCGKCGCVIKKSLKYQDVGYCLACIGGVLFDAGIKVIDG